MVSRIKSLVRDTVINMARMTPTARITAAMFAIRFGVIGEVTSVTINKIVMATARNPHRRATEW